MFNTLRLDWNRWYIADYIFNSMGKSNKDITPLLAHWSYVFLALTHRNEVTWKDMFVFWFKLHWMKFVHKGPIDK